MDTHREGSLVQEPLDLLSSDGRPIRVPEQGQVTLLAPPQGGHLFQGLQGADKAVGLDNNDDLGNASPSVQKSRKSLPVCCPICGS